jgi:hypothetical protein
MFSLIRQARGVVLLLGLTFLVVVLTPIWFVHDQYTRLRSARRQGERSEIRRVPATSTQVDELLRAGEPVVVEGLADVLGIDAATPESLRQRAGDVAVDVGFHDAGHPYFLYSGGYGAQLSDQATMTVAEFLDMMTGGGPPDGTVVYQLLGPQSADGRIQDELDVFDRAISTTTSHRTESRFSGVWIGSRGVVTPLHHDAWPGLLFQTHGRKRVAMFAPSDRCNLSFRSPLHGAGRWSHLPGRSDDATADDFPRLRRATRLEAELRPGDALYIPPFWAHEMEGLEANISVPFRFATFHRSYLNPGFLRPAAEMARARFTR